MPELTMMTPTAALESFVSNYEKVGDASFEKFTDVVHAYLCTDFKFDYINICKSKGGEPGLPDFVIHKLDITYLIDGKTLVQIYNANVDKSPIDVLNYIRTLIVDLINNTFYPHESYLVTLSRLVAINNAAKQNAHESEDVE